jgi:DNA polymerase III delta prime subunit
MSPLEELLIHPKTKKLLANFIRNPSHALMLFGQSRMGKHTLAKAIAASLLDTETEKLNRHQYVAEINPESGISIEDIRRIQHFLSLRIPSSRPINRVVMIIDGGRMRTEAQNALLKNLEEPPAGTCFIITADALSEVLSTIASRTQAIEVLPVDQLSASSYFKAENNSEFEQKYAMSLGNVGLLSSLLSTDEHVLTAAIKKAKEWLSKSADERLVFLNDNLRDKTETANFLEALIRISHAALLKASDSNNKSSASKWHKVLDLAQYSYDAYRKNANQKLLFSNLSLKVA